MGQFQAVYALLKAFSFRYPPPGRLEFFKVGKVSGEIPPPGKFPENLYRVFLWTLFLVLLFMICRSKHISLISIRNVLKAIYVTASSISSDSGVTSDE